MLQCLSRSPSFTVCPIINSNWSGGANLNGVLGGGGANDVDHRELIELDPAETLIVFTHSYEGGNG